MSDDLSPQERLLYRLTVERTLTEALGRLLAAGIDCAPIKGAYLLAELPGFGRAVQDVDLLIAPDGFDRAVEVLAGLGYEARSVQSFAAMMVHPDRALPLDVHRDCFPAGMFRLHARDVLLRATRSDAFGVPALVLDPLDAYALGVGHFAKDRIDRNGAARLAELQAIGEHFALDPVRLAEHLDRHGLGRAARHALARAVTDRGDPLAAAVLRALPEDRLGELAVLGARRWIARWPAGAWQSAPAAHLLNTSLPRACLSGLAHLREALPRRTVRAARRLRASLE